MKTVNALRIRNQLGEVLDMLEAEEGPILIEKRKKVRAVLISYEDFKTRFVDKLANEEKERFIARLQSDAVAEGDADPLQTLRALRGYAD